MEGASSSRCEVVWFAADFMVIPDIVMVCRFGFLKN